MKPETKRWNFIETNVIRILNICLASFLLLFEDFFRLLCYFRYEVISANFSMTKLLGMVRMPTVCGILKVEI